MVCGYIQCYHIREDRGPPEPSRYFAGQMKEPAQKLRSSAEACSDDPVLSEPKGCFEKNI